MKTTKTRNLCIIAGLVLCKAHAAVAGTDVWTGAGADSKWSNADNWSSHLAPVAWDVLVFQDGVGISPYNDLGASTNVGISFSNNASAFTLSGNAVTLSHFSNANGAVSSMLGITNASANTQTINLNVNLDWGNYIFDSRLGSLALNGQLSNSVGGIAFLGTNLTSTSLSVDANGLISGLGGAGLKSVNGVFTGLAMLSGGSVTDYTYSADCQIGTGASIGTNSQSAATNLYITAVPTTTKNISSLANGTGNTFVNSIVFSKTAWTGTNAIGNDSTAGQLVLGTSGGLYIPASGTSRVDITNKFLTAGPESGVNIPGTLVLGVNSSAGFVIYSGITNNITGGAVSVVKTGTGSANIASLNKGGYSGATYLNQGSLIVANANSFGCGPYYISTNANIFVRGNTTNDFYVPAGSYNTGALKLDGVTLSGKITLVGNPVSVGTAGNRVLLNNNSTISGRITGTGTLDVYGNNSGWSTTLNNTSATATNDWTGGLFISGTTKTTVKLGSANQLGGNNVSIFPSTTLFSMLDLNGKSDLIGSLSTPNHATFTNVCIVTNSTATACTLTIGANNASGTFNGIIGGPLALVKIGSGTQSFGANFTVLGTTINEGTVALNSTATFVNNALITITNNGTLDVSARADQTLTLLSNQTVNASGHITGNLAADMGATINWLANGYINGNLSASNGSTINWLGNGYIKGSLTANAGSTINVGGAASIGTFTITTNMSLAGKIVMDLNRDVTPNCDQIFSTPGTYGGALYVTNMGSALQVGDIFHLFPGAAAGFSSINLVTKDYAYGISYVWNNRIAIDGTIQLLSKGDLPKEIWWKGDVSGLWNVRSPNFNWDTDQTSGIDDQAIPEASTIVHFAANGAANLTTSLGEDFSVKSLSFDSVGNVAIGGVNSLTVGAGIYNSAAAGNNVINVASLILPGDQSIASESPNPLVINAPILGANSLNLSSQGSIVLSGASAINTLTLNSGTLKVGNANALALTNRLKDGAVLDLNGQAVTGGFTEFFGIGINGSGAIVNSSANGAKILGGMSINNNTFTVGGSGDIDLARVTGTSGLLVTKNGTGTLSLSGTADNAWLTLIVNEGKVVLSKASGNGVRAIGNGLTINGGMVQLAGTGGDLIFDGNTVLAMSGGLDLNGCSETIATFWLMDVGTGVAQLINNASNTTSTLTVTNDAELLSDATIGGAGNIVLPRPLINPYTVNKVGSGTLTLSGTNSASGTVAVNGGTLALTSAYQGGDIVVNDANALKVVGGGQSAQINNLNLGNTLGATTLVFTNVSNGGIPLLNTIGTVTVAVTNSLSIMTTNGLTVGNLYPLLKYGALSSATFQRMGLVTPSGMTGKLINDTANGVVALQVYSIAPPIATNSTNITVSVSGKTLTLSWPSDHLGWILQSQTNSINVGLSTNWVDIAGSDALIRTNITMDSARSTLFLRLRKP